MEKLDNLSELSGFMNTETTSLISWPKILTTSFPCLGEIFVILHCKRRQLICLILWVSRIDKPKALSLLLHTADISHPAKAWDLHHRWTMSLLEEFFRQVKLGKSLCISAAQRVRLDEEVGKYERRSFSFSLIHTRILKAVNIPHLAPVGWAVGPLGKFVSDTVPINGDIIHVVEILIGEANMCFSLAKYGRCDVPLSFRTIENRFR